MTASSLPRHGGDLSAAVTRFGRMPWLDLSTGINPWPYPVSEVALEEWSRLPTSEKRKTLCTAAARYYGVGPETAVVVAPGTQALIQWLPYLAGQPGESLRVAVVAPTYAEHAVAWHTAGHQVVNVSTLSDITACQSDVAVIVNPNNPDGRVFHPEQLYDIAKMLKLLIIDESFVDVQPKTSFASFLDRIASVQPSSGGVIVLRSFGKFFGLAGLRLGFALLTGRTLAARLKAALGPWAVGGVVLRIGTIALSDERWILSTRQSLHEAATRLDAIFERAGLVVTGGTDLFRLVDCGAACTTVYEGLGQAGILVRALAHFPSQLRFGLPGRREDWHKLTTILLSLCQQTPG
ncbi:L-threonine 3-O-phosphate decarboxylase [invertebrate metagenome]|uniref:threonine-phosphate decarboxylase n=1 Tax=invertebrate metagenome TaxID=1711999 RepID=A0A484H840_9ZZZZ